jgi:hypothetical protein
MIDIAEINKKTNIVNNILHCEDNFLDYYSSNENYVVKYNWNSSVDSEIPKIGGFFLENKYLTAEKAIELELVTKEFCDNNSIAYTISEEEVSDAIVVEQQPQIPVVVL